MEKSTQRNSMGGIGVLVVLLIAGAVYLNRDKLPESIRNPNSNNTRNSSAKDIATTTTLQDLENIEGIITNKQEMAELRTKEYSTVDGRVYGYTNKMINGKMIRTYCELERDETVYNAYKKRQIEIEKERRKAEQKSKK